MRHTLYFILIALLLLTLPACQRSGPTRLRLSHITAPGSPWDKGAQRFARLVNERSGGTLKVDVFPGAQLANANQKTELQMVQTGALDMQLVSPIILALHLDPRFDVFSLPWMFPNHAVANAVMDGPMGAMAAEWLRGKQIETLAFGVNGFRQLTNNDRPVRTPDDLRGLKIRVAGTRLFLEVFTLLGANPTTMNFGELFTALSQGTVAGQENPLSIISSSKLYEVQRYLTLWNYAYDPLLLVINGARWSGLTPEQQQLLRQCAHEAMDFQREVVAQDDTRLVTELMQHGMSVITPSDVQLDAFRAAVEPAYKDFEQRIGADIIARCRAEVARARQAQESN